MRRVGLYARAALFVLVGVGALVGAMLVIARSIVDDAENRLLDERIALARTIGGFLDARIQADLKELAAAGEPLLSPLEPARAAEVRRHLGEEARAGLFAEGVQVLDASGRLIASVPDDPGGFDRIAAKANLPRLLASARARGVALSDLTLEPRPVVLIAMAIRSGTGAARGFVTTLFHPVASNLLDAIRTRTGQGDDEVEIGIIDRRGIFLASTDPQHLFQQADHARVLGRAIGERREFRGRCHNCHEGPGRPDLTPADMDVLAFAPLPSLDLGLTVLQPEKRALAPALALRRRLFTAGGACIALFVMFSALAVRSVVRPIRRLTGAVRRSESTKEPVGASRFGADEIGELAMALELWRTRTLESLAQAEAHREALHSESEAIRLHLASLRAISDVSTARGNMDALAERGLDRALALAGVPAGALRLRHRSRVLTASRGMSGEERDALLDRAAGEVTGSAAAEAGESGETALQIPTVDLAAAGAQAGRFAVAVGGVFRAELGLEIALVLADERPGASIAPPWLGSLLRHVSLCASHLLLREVERERREQQEEYLRRMLSAEEEERTRVARDLHDTVAQDLAALRLEIERVASHSTQPELRVELDRLEGRAHDMLDCVRRILLDLRLSVLESMGFLPALRWLLERTGHEHGIRTQFVVDGDEDIDPSYQRAVTLFRILQESLLNVVHHAGAENIFVTVKLEPGAIELLVEDDGRGFDISASPGPRLDGKGGLGIQGMEERAALLGGTLEVSSAEGEGTTVRVRVPLSPGDGAHAPAVAAEEQVLA